MVPLEITAMLIDVDWVYREFLRRGYRQEYAADFLDQAWKNSGLQTEAYQRTEPDHKPLAARPEGEAISLLREARSWMFIDDDTFDGEREIMKRIDKFLSSLEPQSSRFTSDSQDGGKQFAAQQRSSEEKL
jgi:hypothetical protein